MREAQWARIEDIFNRAAMLPPAEQEIFVSEACGADEQLCRQVTSLLDEDQRIDGLLDAPLASFGLRLIGDPTFDVTPGTFFGRYRVIRLLGQGGMGSVFLAEDVELKRNVALKFIPQLMPNNERSISRFRQEARTASAISHPNIAHIYEFGEFEGRYFLAMEYVPGHTLRELLNQPEIDINPRIDIALQLINAFAAAHKAGITHGDIKPENVILTEEGIVKILDFGLARFSSKINDVDFQQEAEGAGTVAGTPAYMAPEQLCGGPPDETTDVWGLGVVFFEILTGHRPFRFKTADEFRNALLSGDPLSLEAVVPRYLAPVLRKAFEVDRSKRYRNACEFVDELSHAKSVESGRQPSLQRPASWARWTILGLVIVITGYLALGYFRTYSEPITAPNRGLKITNLTKDGRIRDASISADGRYLAYVPIEAGKESLWVRDLSTNEERQLISPTQGPIWGMRFTLDGASVLFVSRPPDSTSARLFRVPSHGGIAVKLIENISAAPAISPDGSRMAYLRSSPSEARDVLFIAGTDGSGEREVSERRHPEHFSASSISWSPDGRSIAAGVERNRGTECSIVSVPADGGDPAELTSWQWAAIGGMAFDPTSGDLLFSARPIGSPILRLWKLSAQSGDLEKITDDENSYEEVTVSAEANSMVVTHTYEVSDLWAVDAAGEYSRLTTQGHEGADGLAILSSGRIVYTRGEYEHSILWSMDLTGGDRRSLNDTIGFLPVASPEGNSIAFVSTEGGVRHIWLMDADGGNKRQLTHGTGENFASFSVDGKWVVYPAHANDAKIKLWKVPVEGGVPIQLTFDGTSIKPVVSPDGKWLVTTYQQDDAGDWRIALLSFADGRIVKLLPTPQARRQMIRWTRDSLSLLYVERHDGAENIWRQPIDGSPPVQVTDFNEDSILHYDSLAERTLIVSRGGRRRDISFMKGYK